jgi:SAM-dependent methyltransferase
MKLDLGSGGNKREGFLGVDISPDCGADIVHDLRVAPWPFEDASVEEVHCSHFFEHLTGAERIVFVEEMYRVMKPGAQAYMITPYWSSMESVQDPTHQWPPIAQGSYYYFNKTWRDQVRIDHYGIHSDFDIRFEFMLHKEWQQRSPQEQQFAARHYLNVVSELIAVLTRR